MRELSHPNAPCMLICRFEITRMPDFIISQSLHSPIDQPSIFNYKDNYFQKYFRYFSIVFALWGFKLDNRHPGLFPLKYTEIRSQPPLVVASFKNGWQFSKRALIPLVLYSCGFCRTKQDRLSGLLSCVKS